MWQGSSASSVDKWIELYNDSDEVVDLSGWSVYKWDDSKGQDILILTVQDGLIAPKGYFLIGHNPKDRDYAKGQSVLDIDPDIIDSSVNWDKNHFKITLCKSNCDDPNMVDVAGDGGYFFKKYENDSGSVRRTDYTNFSGNKIDSWALETRDDCLATKTLDDRNCGTDIATPQNSGRPKIEKLNLSKTKFQNGAPLDFSLDYNVSDSLDDLKTIRLKLVDGDKILDEKEADFGETQFIFASPNSCPDLEVEFIDNTGLWAKKSFNLICFDSSDKIKLYEILPAPADFDCNKDGKVDSNDEWIELVNFGGKPVNLNGWRLKDASGKTFEIADKEIGPEGFKYFCKSQTKIALNNDSETVYLISPDGSIADQTSYKNAADGNSWAKWGNDWYWTTKPTPGEVNVIIQPKVDKSPEFSELQEAEGKKVSLVGTISEVEKSSYVVAFGGGSVNVVLADGVPEAVAGNKITISGLNHSGTVPMIVADSVVLKQAVKIAGTTNLSTGGENSLLPEEQLIEIKRKIKITKRRKSEFFPVNAEALVLGASANRGVFSSNHRQLMLYLLGVAGFMITIFIYDFCCRE